MPASQIACSAPVPRYRSLSYPPESPEGNKVAGLTPFCPNVYGDRLGVTGA